MESVRMRVDPGLPPTTDLAAPPDSVLSTPNGGEFDPKDLAGASELPSTTNSQYGDEPSSRPEPLFQGFERPSFSRIVILTALCLITYPAFYILTLVARDRSLFVVRTIVSVWCSSVGFALGYILLKIGARHLEAATWATVIHVSRGGGGMKLRDLARSSNNPTSFMPAFHILRYRFRNQKTSGSLHKPYDKRPWSLFLGFFVILAILAPQLPFLFGRIMAIETFISNQRKVYREVLIAADTSSEDENRAVALSPDWSAFPDGRGASDTVEFAYDNDTVYFAQPNLSQFLPGGYGLGVFNQSASIGQKDTLNNPLLLTGRNAPKNNAGMILRYSQWGIRIRCEKLPDPQVNLVPLSIKNMTYVFVPRNFLRGLFRLLGTDLPKRFMELDFRGLNPDDTIPSNIDPSTISIVSGVPDDGRGINIYTVPPDFSVGYEWTTVWTVFLRFNTKMATNGSFPVYHGNKIWGKVGYDAAVCVQKYEPWIVEAYNTPFASPSILQIVEKGNGNTSRPSGNIRGPPIANTRYLNTLNKNYAFAVAHINGLLQLINTNHYSLSYFPTPTAVSFTNGTEIMGYTELSPDRLAIIHARLNAANALPYLVGSGLLVAQSYTDETLAFTSYKRWQLAALPILIWALGMIGELFVPKLPLHVPQRDFGLYSWLALFRSQLKFEAADDLNKLMSLEELEERFSDKRVKFAV